MDGKHYRCRHCGHKTTGRQIDYDDAYYKRTVGARRFPPDEASPEEGVTVCPECGNEDPFDEYDPDDERAARQIICQKCGGVVNPDEFDDPAYFCDCPVPQLEDSEMTNDPVEKIAEQLITDARGDDSGMADQPYMSYLGPGEDDEGEPYDTDDDFEFIYEDLTELIQRINPSGLWHGEVEGFGWQNQSGTSDFEADNGQAFLQAILPRTAECYWKLWVKDDKTIMINATHHDSPTWGKEWYTITPRQEDEEDTVEAVAERLFSE